MAVALGGAVLRLVEGRYPPTAFVTLENAVAWRQFLMEYYQMVMLLTDIFVIYAVHSDRCGPNKSSADREKKPQMDK